MATRTRYSPGTFSWTDLPTPDQAAAKQFYGGLFGWEADDRPVSEGVVYSMMKLGGETVAAISPQPQQQRDAGAPPLWNSYITVQSADDTLAKASELGAHVHAGPFDVFDAGRMGVAQDPQGAFFLVWQPMQTAGASLVNAPGALSWNELHTPDVDAAESFYGELFGWSTEQFPTEHFEYRIIKTADGHTNGSLTNGLRPGDPPHWLVYFGAEGDEAVTRVRELGGSVEMEPTELAPGVRISVVADPQGARFALYSGRFED